MTSLQNKRELDKNDKLFVHKMKGTTFCDLVLAGPTKKKTRTKR